MIDPFTIKPLDSKTIIDNAKATRGRIITVEDHYYEGTASGQQQVQTMRVYTGTKGFPQPPSDHTMLKTG